MSFEVGLNTRHFSPATDAKQIAFRESDTVGAGEAGTPSFDGPGGGTAVSTSLRFTGRAPFNTFLGVEGEAGTLLGHHGSNLAGAYGVVGARGELSRIRLAVETVAGRRWVRYGLDGLRSDPATWVVEPRVRADLWLGSQVTLGAAVGATLGDRSVWMAGVYLGFSSSDFNRWR